MAMSLPHQIGAMAGTPVTADSGTLTAETATPAKLGASAFWKTPGTAAATNLRVSVHKAGEMDRVSPLPSPPLSPVMRADLSAACRAFAVEAEPATAQGLHALAEGARGAEKGVPVFVMMPLDSVRMDNSVNRRKAMNASMHALKSAGVEGIMMDVWWGLVERDGPGNYNWGGYSELMEMARKHGLKVQAVMSFHQCGGNVGDSCTSLFLDARFDFLLLHQRWKPYFHPLCAIGLGRVRPRFVTEGMLRLGNILASKGMLVTLSALDSIGEQTHKSNKNISGEPMPYGGGMIRQNHSSRTSQETGSI